MKTFIQFVCILSMSCSILFLSSCQDEDSGSFDVEVSFGSPRPKEPCSLTAEIRQIQPEGPAILIKKLSPVTFTPDVQALTGESENSDDDSASQEEPLSFTGVPYGDDYVLLVNMYDSGIKRSGLLYTGISSRFSFHRGDKLTLPVVLSHVVLSLADTEIANTSPSSTANLHIAMNKAMLAELEGETEIILSNASTFENPQTKLLNSLTASSTGYQIDDWDLNQGVCGEKTDCMDGDRFVYARIVNSVYGRDDIVLEIHIMLDSAAPELATPLPHLPVVTNQSITMDVYFSEPVISTTVEVDCDGFGFRDVTPVDGRINYANKPIDTHFQITCSLEPDTENRMHTITVSAKDQSGRSTGRVVLGEVEVDTMPPALQSGVTHAPDVASVGDLIKIEFTLTEPIEEFVVTVGETNVTDYCSTKSADNLQYHCMFVTTPELIKEGFHEIAVSLKEKAGNESNFFRQGGILFDYTTHPVMSSSVTPFYAGVGATINVSFFLKKVPASWNFFSDGLEFADLAPVPEDVSQRGFRGSHIVSEDDENKHYDLLLSYTDSAGNLVDNLEIGQVTIDTIVPSLTEDITIDRRVIKKGELFELRFSVSEELANISVRVGLSNLNVNAVCDKTNEGLSYTCRHIMPEGESEGEKSVVITMWDFAANMKQVSTSEPIITYNIAEPNIESVTTTPKRVKIGDTASTSLIFTEDVGNVEINWGGLTGAQSTLSEDLDKLHFFEISIPPGTEDGSYDIVLESAEDSLGMSVPGLPKKIDVIEVDNTPPTVRENSFKVKNNLVKSGDTTEISFIVSEPLQSLKLFIGDFETGMTSEENCNGANICEYRHTVSSDVETNGLKYITMEMIDLAGNISQFPPPEEEVENRPTITYDFLPPTISISTSVAPKPAMDGDRLTLDLFFSEKVRVGSIRYDWGDLALGSLIEVGRDRQHFRASYTVSSNDKQGRYPLKITQVEDEVGNRLADGDVLHLPDAIIARIVYVQHNPTKDEDGLSWESAYSGLQTAITNAEPGQQIWVKRDDTPYSIDDIKDTSISRDDALEIVGKEIKMYGGFKGNEEELTERDISNPDHYSILDGRSAKDKNIYLYHVVTVTDGGQGYLDGFVIRNGRADGPASTDKVGGGVLIERGALTLANCIVEDNTAAIAGGGLYGHMSSLNLVNTTIIDNTAEVEGGGVFMSHSFASPIHVSRSLFYWNTAQENGGGLLLDRAQDVVIHNTTFRDNQSVSGFGGGIASQNADVSLANSVFYDNKAQYGGGISSHSPYEVEIDHSTFLNNESSTAGNSLYVVDSEAAKIDISSSIFWGVPPVDESHPCQIESKLFDGTIIPEYSNLQLCERDTNAGCDATTCIPPKDPRLILPEDDNDVDDYILEPTADSPGIDIVPCDERPNDALDLNENGDVREMLPVDMAMSPRCESDMAGDIGAYEYR